MIITGDNVGDGPNPREVVDKIISMKAWVIKRNKEEKVLISGHTHRHFIMEVNDKLILNPESVGLPINKEAQAEYIIVFLMMSGLMQRKNGFGINGCLYSIRY